MKTYIALLRGINVSGQKKIKMADLKTLLEELSFTNVRTYIQSGNVIFKSRLSSVRQLEKKIGEAIIKQFGFQVTVIVKTPAELKYVLNNNPFVKRKQNPERMYVTFLSNVPSTDNLTQLKEIDYQPEEYYISDRYIYLFFPNGYGKAKMNNNFFENKLKVFATTRNWKTVNTLLKMSLSVKG